MTWKIRQTKNVEICQSLHRKAFPSDDWDSSDVYWLVTNEQDKPVGYCGLNVIQKKFVFFNRAAVMYSEKGNGLQRRLIKVRERWTRESGYKTAITYVRYDNHPSLVNLIKCGWILYFPQWEYAGKVHYLYKKVV